MERLISHLLLQKRKMYTVRYGGILSAEPVSAKLYCVFFSSMLSWLCSLFCVFFLNIVKVKQSCAGAFCNLADLPAMHSRLIEEGAVSTVREGAV